MSTEKEKKEPVDSSPLRKKRLGNLPGEPAFQLKVEPERELRFRYRFNEPTSVELRIINTSSDRQCFKVKCTDNKLFKMLPTTGFLVPDEVGFVKVVLTTPSEPKNNFHYLAVFHVKAKESVSDYKKAFAEKPDGVTRLICSFDRDPVDENNNNTEGGGHPDDKKSAASPVEKVADVKK